MSRQSASAVVCFSYSTLSFCYIQNPMRRMCLYRRRGETSNVGQCLAWFEKWTVKSCLAENQSLLSMVVSVWLCDAENIHKKKLLRQLQRCKRRHELTVRYLRFLQGCQGRNRYDLFAASCERFQRVVGSVLFRYYSSTNSMGMRPLCRFV